MTSGCRLSTVVEPHGMRFGRPSAAHVVIIPTDEGKKHGQRARSLSTSTWSAFSEGRRFTAMPSATSSASNAIVPADGNA